MALPKEPRQKMINLMYLVLTALLAMNVSSEILLAFKTVNNSLVKTNEVLQLSTTTVMTSLKDKISKAETKEKALIWYPEAEHVQKESESMYAFLNSVKDSLINGSKSDPKDTTYKEDDLNAATRILVTGGLGKALHDRLQAYRTAVLKNPELKATFEKSLPIDLTIPKTQTESNQDNWERAYFNMTPTIAAITILSKFQNDVKTTENRLISEIHSKVGQVDVRFDQFAPLLTSNSTYLMPGDEIELSAGVAAFSSANKPTISINGAGGQPGPDGFVKSKFRVSGSGTKTVNATFSYVDQNNVRKTETKTVTYTVGTPGNLAVSTDKTRVFYQGLENPLTVRGQGGSESLKVNISGAGTTIRSLGGGQYMVTATSTGAASLTASDGKTNQTISIPVKRVPSPLPHVNGKYGGSMNVGEFRAAAGVGAVLKDFVFEGVSYQVTSFLIVFSGAGFEDEGFVDVNNSGAYFSAEAKRAQNRCKAGSQIQIEDIKVNGPGGPRKLEGVLSFILQ